MQRWLLQVVFLTDYKKRNPLIFLRQVTLIIRYWDIDLCHRYLWRVGVLVVSLFHWLRFVHFWDMGLLSLEYSTSFRYRWVMLRMDLLSWCTLLYCTSLEIVWNVTRGCHSLIKWKLWVLIVVVVIECLYSWNCESIIDSESRIFLSSIVEHLCYCYIWDRTDEIIWDRTEIGIVYHFCRFLFVLEEDRESWLIESEWEKVHTAIISIDRVSDFILIPSEIVSVGRVCRHRSRRRVEVSRIDIWDLCVVVVYNSDCCRMIGREGEKHWYSRSCLVKEREPWYSCEWCRGCPCIWYYVPIYEECPCCWISYCRGYCESSISQRWYCRGYWSIIYGRVELVFIQEWKYSFLDLLLAPEIIYSSWAYQSLCVVQEFWHKRNSIIRRILLFIEYGVESTFDVFKCLAHIAFCKLMRGDMSGGICYFYFIDLWRNARDYFFGLFDCQVLCFSCQTPVNFTPFPCFRTVIKPEWYILYNTISKLRTIGSWVLHLISPWEIRSH